MERFRRFFQGRSGRRRNLLILSGVLFLVFLLRGGRAGAEEFRLGIMSLNSSTLSSQEVGGVTDELASTLADPFSSIKPLERQRQEELNQELRLSLSGLVDASTAVEVGKRWGCQYMLLGSVEREKSALKFDLRLVNVETSVVENGHPDTAPRHAAILRVGDWIRGIVGEHALVLKVNAVERTVEINRGRNAGVQEGDIYRVYIADRSLGPTYRDIAVIRVTDVRAELSFAGVEPKGGDFGSIRPEDRIETITEEKSKELIRQGKFFPRPQPTSRPAPTPMRTPTPTPTPNPTPIPPGPSPLILSPDRLELTAKFGTGKNERVFHISGGEGYFWDELRGIVPGTQFTVPTGWSLECNPPGAVTVVSGRAYGPGIHGGPVFEEGAAFVVNEGTVEIGFFYTP